jgi:hypothetical protein
MRTRILTIVVLLALAGAAATTAIAQSENNTTTSDGSGGAGGNGNATALHEWQREHVQNLSAFRRQALESFAENRTLLQAMFEANLSQIRTTFLEGKVAAIESCLAQAAPYGRTDKGPHDGVYADCMKTALESLRDNATAAHKAQVDNWRTSIAALREASKDQFQSDKAAWEAAHPRP